jgi:hypothetical protein
LNSEQRKTDRLWLTTFRRIPAFINVGPRVVMMLPSGRFVVTNAGPTPESDLHISFVEVEVGLVGSRVELFKATRRDRLIEAPSIREVAQRHKVQSIGHRARLISASQLGHPE